MLLDRGRRHFVGEVFNVGGDVDRPNAHERVNSLPFAPSQKQGGGMSVGRPRVLVANVDGEEFEEA